MTEFLQHVPTFGDIIRLSPPLVAYIVVSGWISGLLKRRYRLRANYTRKVFHFLIFSLAAYLHWQYGLTAVNLLGGLMGAYLTLVLLLGDGHLFYEALAREQDAPHRSFYIVTSYLATAAGGILSNILFHGYAVVGYLVTGWGDAIGEPVGARFGRHRYRVSTFGNVVCYRSLEGSIAVAVTSFLAAFVTLYGWLHLPVMPALLLGFFTAMLSTIVEAISTHGIDNLTIQLAASGLPFVLVKLITVH